MIIGQVLGVEISLIVVVNLIFFLIYFVAFVKAYIRMGTSPKDIKYFLLEEAFLCLECDFKTAANHCIETFSILGARVLETDFKKGTIEAYTTDNMIHVFGGLYEIQIYEKRKKYDFNKTYITVKYNPKYSIINQKIIQSLNINKFIRVFLD